MSEIAKFEEYVFYNKLCLSIIGIWPLPHGTPTWRLYLQNVHIFLIFILLLFCLLLPEGLDLYMFWENIDAIVENLCVTIYTTTIFMKFSYFISKKSTFKVRI